MRLQGYLKTEWFHPPLPSNSMMGFSRAGSTGWLHFPRRTIARANFELLRIVRSYLLVAVFTRTPWVDVRSHISTCSQWTVDLDTIAPSFPRSLHSVKYYPGVSVFCQHWNVVLSWDVHRESFATYDTWTLMDSMGKMQFWEIKKLIPHRCFK